MNSIINKIKTFSFINILKDECATKTINVHDLTYIQRLDYEKLDIDVDSMLITTQENSMYSSISSKIFYTIENLGMKTKVINVDIDATLIEIKREEKISQIFNEDILNKKTILCPGTSYKATSILFNELYNLCSKIKPNVIFTNGKLGAVIEDSRIFKQIDGKNKINLVSNSQYFIGTIFGCDVYIDAYMTFNDNRIFVGNVNLDFIHDNKLEFNNDYTKLEYGYDILLNGNSRVEVLNIIDDNMSLI